MIRSKHLFLFVFLLIGISCKRKESSHNTSDDNVKYAKEALDDALNNRQRQQIVDKMLIDSNIKSKPVTLNVKDSAVRYAENILFKIYTKDQILQERPYNVNSVNGYWVITGTMNQEGFGGAFLIIINANNGKVIELIHGK